MSLFVAQYCNASIAMASAMTFYWGIVLVFAFGFLGFGGCISDFISHHVITGFCSAAAFITTITQIPKVLGLHTRGRSPISILVTVYEDLGKMNMYDCYIGFFSMLTLILLKNMPEHMKAKPFFKLLSTGRNAFLVFVLGNWTYMTCKDQCAYTLISITAENTGIKFETPELSMENFTYGKN